MKSILIFMLAINGICLGMHIYLNCQTVFYFFQLTILGQILVVVNFGLSAILNQKKQSIATKRFLSQLHLITISLQVIIVIGFWGIRLMLGRKFIDKKSSDLVPYDMLTQFLSVYVHGGSLLTMFTFIKYDQILITEPKKKREKALIHLVFWAIPFIILQIVHKHFTGDHIYGFITHFTWPILFTFELFLYAIAVICDHLLELLHGNHIKEQMLIQQNQIDTTKYVK